MGESVMEIKVHLFLYSSAKCQAYTSNRVVLSVHMTRVLNIVSSKYYPVRILLNAQDSPEPLLYPSVRSCHERFISVEVSTIKNSVLST